LGNITRYNLSFNEQEREKRIFFGKKGVCVGSS